MHGDNGAPDLDVSLRKASKAFRRTWAARLDPWDLTPFQWRTLRAINERGGSARPGEIAERLGIAPRSATEAVDQLESKGFVERARDPGDRRATQVRLTARGRELVVKLAAQRLAHAEQFFAPLSKAEQETLSGLLAKLAADT